MSAPLRCGLIGIGMMGRNHARVLRELTEAELVVIADPGGDPDNVGYGVPVVSSVEQALDYRLDCAIVAVPTEHHESVAVSLAQARIPTLIEKPLADSVESAKRIADAFQAAQTLATVGHIERFNPAVQQLSKRLEAGELGEVFQIATRRQSSFPGRISDVGVVKDLATHDIDLALFLSRSDYQDIAAFTSHRSGRTNEDMLVASGKMENGIIVNHVVNWLSPVKERVTVVTGETGVFVADTLTGDLTLHRNGHFTINWDSLATFRGVSEGDTTRFAYSRTEPLKSELSAFFGVIRGDRRQFVSLAEGVRVATVIEEIVFPVRTI